MHIKGVDILIPDSIGKQFKDVVKASSERKLKRFYETDDEKVERWMKQLNIQKHGKGKRKKRNKKKGGSR